VYSLILGDFELSQYQLSDGVTFLFVTLTLLGTIIMLNVLIAVVTNSYEGSIGTSVIIFRKYVVGRVKKFGHAHCDSDRSHTGFHFHFPRLEQITGRIRCKSRGSRKIHASTGTLWAKFESPK
jgi:hypothetical protein